ncbi:AbrB/MazE/SpoVT family DNA-binding domain-containing protein [Halopenitus sp. POP-27]|uniref:AbrB/MazE/SpoVT family DNA-binding domain-containing protein n=1 Tax=Halopenitus sp. POP-27 TaxID=2994425 RepID=UPI0024684B77|nr:AbrB/MazE/SpoVT family DNA-binding domain-containing protein [Halopenitus sp. POP-27]
MHTNTVETRKVQTVGNGTYTVSLPKEWAEAEGVAAGDTVTLHRHTDGILAVQARNRNGVHGRIGDPDTTNAADADATKPDDTNADDAGTTKPNGTNAAGTDTPDVAGTNTPDAAGTGGRVEADTRTGGNARNGPSIRTPALDPPSLEGTLRAAYAAGIRTVEVDHEEPLDAEQRHAVESVCRGRIGTSTATTDVPGTAVRMLLDPGEVSVTQSVRQLAFVVDATQQAAIESVATATQRAAVAERAEHAERLWAMIDRTVALGMADLEAADAIGVSRAALFESWTAMRELERVREAAADVAEAGSRMDDPPAESRIEELREIAETVRSGVSDGVSVVVGDTGAETARQALEGMDQARETIDAFDHRLATAEDPPPELRAVLSRLRRTAERGGAIAELGLRRTIRRTDEATGCTAGTAGSASR